MLDFTTPLLFSFNNITTALLGQDITDKVIMYPRFVYLLHTVI